MWRPAALFLATVMLVAASCQGYPPVTPCQTAIPAGGCPLDRGGTCDDPTCTDLYSCNNAVWVHLQKCGAHDGGADAGDAGPSVCSANAGAGPDAGGCVPVHVDTTGQATDCTPDLAFPDCPASAVEGCAECVCLTGCADFYLCKAQPSLPSGPQPPAWAHVAYCDDLGNFAYSTQ